MSAEELREQINQATAPLMPGAESTSARLARVERERDEVRAQLDRTIADNADLIAENIHLREAVASAQIERDDAQALNRAVGRERDGVREELARQAAECEDLRATLAIRSRQLASARVELDHLRAERDAAFEAAAKPTENRG